jgi:hypothetical protein
MSKKEKTMQKNILYFEKPGNANTDATLNAARARAEELGIRQVVIASSHGSTALRAREIFSGLPVQIIAVSINAAYSDLGWSMTEAERKPLVEQGIQVLTSVHTLGDDVNSSFDVKTPNVIVRETLYTFSQGMKVAVEIALMAADAGLLDMRGEVIAIAGTDNGADTAIVITPAYSRKFTDLRIREILTKPR